MQDIETGRWRLKNHDGCFRELADSGESAEDAEEVDLRDVASRPQFREAQEDDEELRAIQAQIPETRSDQPETDARTPQYEVRGQLLYWAQRGWQVGQEEVQLVVPTQFHWLVWQLVQANPTGGHLGQDKTIARVASWVFLAGTGEDIAHHCVACPECQRMWEDHSTRAPLQPLPVIYVPFSWIVMDVRGPLPCSTGHQYVLVFIDYATQYLKAVPLGAL